MEVYIGGKRYRPTDDQSRGKGGEADVYEIEPGVALKIWKPPSHPDFDGSDHDQKAAAERIALHQIKMRAFPKNLPPHIVTPMELATDRAGKLIHGYTMPFKKGAEVLFSYAEPGRSPAITEEMVRHTDRFVDPLNCDPKHSGLMLYKQHTKDSDWFAYAVMLLQCLIRVAPYGGVYRPKNKKNEVAVEERPKKGITIFHNDVIYPKPARPFHYARLPDDLLHHFASVFTHKLRGPFPQNLIEGLQWTKCVVCGLEHARVLCPQCSHTAPAAIKQVIQVRGKVTATRIFRSSGEILFAAVQNRELLWLYHENNQFLREDKTVVFQSPLDHQVRYRLRGKQTLFGKGNQLVTLDPSARQPARTQVDCYQILPIFDANAKHSYWSFGGRLYRDDKWGEQIIGNVLAGQTLFWTGPEFGFGFYRAGQMSVAFVFDAEQLGINDQIKLPRLRGQLIDSTCFFGKDRCWFMVAMQDGGRIIHQCMLIKRDGKVEAFSQAEKDDGSWLGTLRGKCAINDFLLAATDDGIVQVEAASGRLQKTKEQPDTEPFVDASCHLFFGKDGLYVVDRHDITVLKFS